MSTADKLTTIAENQQKVYDAGKQKQYNELWDSLQWSTGLRKDYSYFLYNSVASTTKGNWFRPKHNIYPTNMSYFTYTNSQLNNTDMVAVFNLSPGNLDTSRCTNFNYAFHKGCHWGVIDTTAASSLDRVFYQNSLLHTIDEIIFKESQTYTTSVFYACSKLVNIKTSGTIGTTISFSYCPLSVESAKSVINILKNYAGTDGEYTHKLTFKSTVWTALNEAEAPPTGNTWQEYVQTLGWLYA